MSDIFIDASLRLRGLVAYEVRLRGLDSINLCVNKYRYMVNSTSTFHGRRHLATYMWMLTDAYGMLTVHLKTARCPMDIASLQGTFKMPVHLIVTWNVTWNFSTNAEQ